MKDKKITAKEAMERLRKGNKKYVTARNSGADVSRKIRLKTARDGQFPYAIVISCSDSRAVPEHIFGAGIGEIFTIRVAGNVIDKHQLGSIEYAVSHLGSPLVVVMGHTGCGAVGAAISDGGHGFVSSITNEIKEKIGDEKDDYRASCFNVIGSVHQIRNALSSVFEKCEQRVHVVGCVYKLETGRVKWLKS